MQEPTSFYQQQRDRFTAEVESLRKQSNRLSLARIVVFLVVLVLSIQFYELNYVLLPTVGIGLFLFLRLLLRHTNVREQRGLAQRLVVLNLEELAIARGDYFDRDDGLAYMSPSHPFAQDIDLFGRGSFYQYINRTGLNTGAAKLAALLNSNGIKDIEERQEAIKELAEDPEWLQRYTALAQGTRTELSQETIIKWLSSYQPFIKPAHRYMGWAFGLASLLLLSLSILELVPLKYLGYWLLLGLALSARFLKQVNALAFRASTAKDYFRQYSLLLDAIEQRSFKAPLLKQWQAQVQQNEEKASVIFKKFSKALDALDHRNNLIMAVLGNGFFLWDLLQSYRVEGWIKRYGHMAEDWFEIVASFDAYNSLGGFAFNHQEYSFPVLTDSEMLICAKDLGHPLIRTEKRITSDLEISDSDFFIVTGANMAGKSTFLRAVALHIVMANTGLPVCASSSSYQPIRLISSMRTSDSLTDESSYFFSELTRLKFIVEALKEQRYFVILDEILKGTNSTDKAIGSRKFVQRLVSLKACGIIATHDLSLTELAAEQPLVKNYFFDADIRDDELYFDYKFKKGICQNMNASFLLKKMGIV